MGFKFILALSMVYPGPYFCVHVFEIPFYQYQDWQAEYRQQSDDAETLLRHHHYRHGKHQNDGTRENGKSLFQRNSSLVKVVDRQAS
jgi:hypothetical protein